MVLNTRKEIGNAALSTAIAYFGSNGYIVSIPLNDTQDYDLVVDNGKVCKTVNKTDIDLLFCLCGDGSMYLIPHEKIKNESAINLSTQKSIYSKKSSIDYSQYKVEM